MIKKQENKFQADTFWVMAMERMDTMDNESDVRKRDLTRLFWEELEERVKKGELININLGGPVRMGKSTAAQAVCYEIKRFIKKHWNVDRPMSNANILRDQNEYSRIVKRRPESFKHECDVIDEWAEMELTGYNATIESKYLKDFSDRQAARYYHRVSCSPTNITDENSDISLQVVPGSRRDGETLCLLSYRLQRGGYVDNILLGRVTIKVKRIMNERWYIEYLKKKEEKWELMNKHNVKSPRELEYAEIIINTYNTIKDGAKIGLTKRKFIKPILQEEADKKGVWFSILGDKDILETLEGMAELTESIFKIDTKLKNNKISRDDRKEFKSFQKLLRSNLGKILTRLSNLSQLWYTYQLIEKKELEL